MSVFVDTSALAAVIDAVDINHASAQQQWNDLIIRKEDLVCTNYILTECVAVIQRKIGIKAVRLLHEDITQVLRIEWITHTAHSDSMNALLTASRRQLSLVDCTSFVTMRQLGIKSAFAFDVHFTEQGFHCLPA